MWSASQWFSKGVVSENKAVAVPLILYVCGDMREIDVKGITNE